jgi:catechol 2,3-dioxygenase-like lactoylglutathione lyase family enzyme
MKGQTIMNWTLEVVVVPVSDVDRAKTFYAEKLGFDVDHDTRISEDYRVVQLTPPGSGCSIVVGRGVVDMPPGSLKGLQLVVKDIRVARTQLVERGVEASEVLLVGASGPRPARDGEDLDNVGFVFFSDPDGNGWAVQQISARD